MIKRDFSINAAICSATTLAILPLPMAAHGSSPPTIDEASPAIATDSAVFVERQRSESIRSLEPATKLRRGDRVVTVLTWYRMGGSGGFTITNPVPGAISYQESASSEEVSVDGGKTWGRLADLKVGPRQATPEDVTHVRWRIPSRLAERGRGNIAYSGIVR